MSSEVRGVMSPGILKLTDAKIIFVHSKSGRKDTVKVRVAKKSNKIPQLLLNRRSSNIILVSNLKSN